MVLPKKSIGPSGSGNNKKQDENPQKQVNTQPTKLTKDKISK